MSRRLVAMLAGVAALAILVMAGCGGGSDDDSLTKAEFIKQADAICTTENSQVGPQYKAFAKAHGIKTGEFPSEAQGFEVAEQIYIPGVEKRVAAIRELNPPEGEEDTVEAILVATEDGIAAAKKNIKSVFGAKNPFEKSKELSKKYGFKVCGTL